MGECIPFRNPGEAIPVQAVSAITGKLFVKVVAARLGGGARGLSTDTKNLIQVGPCTASGEAALGVSKFDTPIGGVGGVFARSSGYVVPVIAGAAITAGQEVQTDATGKAIPLAAGKALGYALDDAANAADAEIKLY